MAERSDSRDAVHATSEGEFHLVQTAQLRVGTRLKIPIYDERHVLLLAEGQDITAHFLRKLEQRGMTSVRVHESELPRICAGQPQGTAVSAPPERAPPANALSNAGTDLLDRELLRGQLGLPPQGAALAAEVQAHGVSGYDEALKDKFVGRQAQAVNRMQSVFQSLASGKGLDVAGVTQVADEALADMVQDADLFAALGINPFASDYPARHSMHVCMLAIAIGTRLSLDRPTLKELAVGCLIHDSGMQRLKPGSYDAPRVLTPIEFLEITKHPIIVFDMMKDMRAVSNRSAFIAYQMHERCDGSGYPRRRDGAKIHFLSKVAAVADAYVGLVSPRPHRPALLPYYAVEKILQGVPAGLFDASAVRAVLQTVSLFPLGSCVQLSDGRMGRVIRTNADAYASPIVEAWDPGELREPPEVIDLTASPVRVIGPLADLESGNAPLCVVPADAAARAATEVRNADGSHLRRHVRREARLSVAVFPCPEGTSPAPSPSFPVETKDISEGGLGFRCERSISTDHVIVEMPEGERRLALLSRVMRSIPIEGRGWEFGVTFVLRLPDDWRRRTGLPGESP